MGAREAYELIERAKKEGRLDDPIYQKYIHAMYRTPEGSVEMCRRFFEDKLLVQEFEKLEKKKYKP